MSYEDPISSPASTASATGAAAEKATQAWETTQVKAREALQTGEQYVRENPATSVLSILGLGFVLGVLVGYSVAHEDHEDYSASTRKFLKRWGHKLNLD